jgi:hypothetical protein
VGQQVSAESGPRWLHLEVSFVYTSIDPTRHRVALDVRFPLGVTVHEDLDCVSLGPHRCRVNYHCNFDFLPGIRGWLARRVLRGEVESGPADSLRRLKEAAEDRARRNATASSG